jgi:hypothetical protein
MGKERRVWYLNFKYKLKTPGAMARYGEALFHAQLHSRGKLRNCPLKQNCKTLPQMLKQDGPGGHGSTGRALVGKVLS